MDSQKNDRCIHELYIEQCAYCLNIKTPEEEQKEMDKEIVRLSERYGRKD